MKHFIINIVTLYEYTCIPRKKKYFSKYLLKMTKIFIRIQIIGKYDHHTHSRKKNSFISVTQQ